MAVTLTKTVKTRATRATKAREQKAVTELLNVPNVANLLPAPVEQPVNEPVIKNGIKAPMRAGKCKHVWEVCEVMYKATGKVPTLQELNAHEAMQGTNTTNNQIEFYRWRKYNGLNAK